MLKCTNLSQIPPLSTPCALTIGNFDGVHQGHRSLIKRAKSFASPHGTVALITFANHPTEFFNPKEHIPKLCTQAQKGALLEKAGVDLLITLPFTQEFASQSTKTFLSTLKRHLPFSHLILGKKATLGRNRQGNETTLSSLQTALQFSSHFLPKCICEGAIISSGLIRKKIQDGQLFSASTLLGRPYSLSLHVNTSSQAKADSLCLPPPGNYPVTVRTPTSTHEQTITITSLITLKNTPPGPVEIVFNFATKEKSYAL